MFTVGPARASFKQPLIDAITDLELTTGLKLCLDAGDINSYPGTGQKWLDLSGGGYDFFLGADGTASAADPTFNGTAGGLSASEYWSGDGGDYFTYDSANESWMQNLHKDGAVCTLAGYFYVVVQGDAILTGTCRANLNDDGLIYVLDGGETPAVRVFRSDIGGSALTKTADNALSTDAWHFIACSIDENGGDVSFLYVDGDYAQVGASNTFDANYSSPHTGNASNTMQIMAGGGSSIMASGSRCSGLMVWEGTALTKAQLDDVFAATNRYGL